MLENSESCFEIEFVSGPDDGEVKRFYSREVIVGSAPEADLVFVSDGVASGKHARIQYLSDGLWIEDLESECGTVVNGERIAEKRKVGQSDIVCIGHTEFICRSPEPDDTASRMTGRQCDASSGT